MLPRFSCWEINIATIFKLYFFLFYFFVAFTYLYLPTWRERGLIPSCRKNTLDVFFLQSVGCIGSPVD